jgi:hypothetical protein
MNDAPRLEQTAAHMRESVRQYTDELIALAGSKLLGLTLYGPIARGQFIPARHAVQSVVVLDHIDLDLLRRLARDGSRFGRKHISAPLMMTPASIRESRDTFPLEFLEIQQCRVHVLGTDYFADLKFEREHVRLQCERELKSQLIGLRQGLLAAAGREKLLGTLEVNVVNSLLRAMRGLIWLQGRTAPVAAETIVTEMEGLTHATLNGIRAILDDSAARGWDQFVGLYNDLLTLQTKADVR